MGNTLMEISVPLDKENFIELECDFCKNRFMLHQDVYESDDNINFFCPICGLPNKINTFFVPEVLEKAQNGEDFDTLISNYSPNTANDSDENGYIFTDNETGIEFEEGVDSIKTDEFTIVQSDSGYYVMF